MSQSMQKLRWTVGCNTCIPGTPKTQFIRVHRFWQRQNQGVLQCSSQCIWFQQVYWLGAKPALVCFAAELIFS